MLHWNKVAARGLASVATAFEELVITEWLVFYTDAWRCPIPPSLSALSLFLYMTVVSITTVAAPRASYRNNIVGGRLSYRSPDCCCLLWTAAR